MKYFKKIYLFLITLLFLFLYLNINNNIVFAHTQLVDIEYDSCEPNENYDGENELWYSLLKYDFPFTSGRDSHLSDNVTTIYYWISDSARTDENYTWTTDVDSNTANDIKQSFVNSMLKWNNVYYYSYDSSGNVTKNKIINIEESSSESDANLIIYPIRYYTDNFDSDENVHFYAQVGASDETGTFYRLVEDDNNYIHWHFNKWEIDVNVNLFYEHPYLTMSSSEYNVPATSFLEISKVRERTGMHEVGHILGLDDIDTVCTVGTSDHHKEVLMGYGNPVSSRKEYATYKDIAGISITRGFHTDNDHIWMKRNNDDSTIDLICALCNGVRFNVQLNSIGEYEGKPVNVYKDCCHHDGNILSTNMLLVATDGVRDFFKCLNCRHIEEVSTEVDINLISSFTSEVFQNELEAESYIYYKIKSPYGNGYNFSLSSLNSISLELLDDNLNIVDSVSNLTNVNFSKYLDYGVYYIKIKNNSSISNSYTFEISEHTHTYTYETDENNRNNHIRTCTTCGYKSSVSHSNSNHYCIYCNAYTNAHDYGAPYTWLNIYNHQATCCCGETTTQVHAVKSGTTKCLLCGGNAGSGIVQMNVMSNGVRFVSAKGSFITNEGIVVLVEEDIEAYLNNELEFYINNTSTK